jgi:hypothetical protein
MPFARLDNLAVGLAEQIIAKFESIFARARRIPSAPIGGDPDDGAEG